MKTLYKTANAFLLLGILLLAYHLNSPSARGRVEFGDNPVNDFIRGDSNDDGVLNVSDAVFTLSFLFIGDEQPECLAANDTNDDGEVNITDVIRTLNFLFLGGTNAPPAPFPDPGADPTRDLGCREPPLPGIPGVGSLGGPDRELDRLETISWKRGKLGCNHFFSANEGLGPLFNGDSCRGCHLAPVMGGAGGLDVDVVRFAKREENGDIVQLDSGPAVSRLAVHGVARDELNPEANIIETRQTPSLLGLGLVDRLPEAALLANADPEDADGDGISGRALMINGRIGRFGHKASIPSFADFCADAFINEMGVTVNGLLADFAVEIDTDSVSDPELADQDFVDLVFFSTHLAPPARSFPDNPSLRERINKGEDNFNDAGCASCHGSALNGDEGPVAAFSDFLLHDVANPARLIVPEADAEPGEFRTAPLWGVRQTAPYLHDGSAETLRDAILLHFGEASPAK
ncbi:MAG: hypothetical protein MK133_15050, partial [Planctomycetes bacterium]|nr:hypothetical protein [Planctomycetota bacterium]